MVTILIFTVGIAQALAAECRLSKVFSHSGKTYTPCEVTGDSGSGKSRTYQVHCEGMPEMRHVEFEKSGEAAKLLDSSSRDEIDKCTLDKTSVDELVKSYEGRVNTLENPPCYLSRWKGQMAFFANGVKGRCTFDMKKEQADEFTKKMGVEPFYQCEKGYFLVIPKVGAAEIFRPAKGSWESVCKAPTKVGEPVEDIDWKKPPKYYQPK